MKKTNNYYPWIFINAFEGEGEGDAAPPAGGTFTQAQVDTMMAEAATAATATATDTFKAENAQTLQNLNMLKTKAQLSDKEKTQLNTKIAELETKVFSADEIASRDREKITTEYTENLERATAESENWRNRFSEATISRSITDAAVKHEAINPTQIPAFLRDRTTLVEKMDEEGTATGIFEPIVSYKTKDKKKADVTLKLSPEKAVELMKEDPSYFNLFKGKTKGGTGSTNEGTAGQIDMAELAKDPVAYAAHRKANK